MSHDFLLVGNWNSNMSGITPSSGSSSGEITFTISSKKRKIPPAEEEDDESGNEKEIHVEEKKKLIATSSV
jgi:hypothetical protein